ncbi:ABC transporter ATP-binding protein [Roseomonas sp. GCM10028921]
MSRADGPLLDVRGLEVDIPVPGGTLHAVRGVTLSVRHGETLCIVGESGCGKSLTSLALMGLLPAGARRRAERLTLAGENLMAGSPRRLRALRGDRMAMIFQDPMTCLNPSLTIGDQLTETFLRHGKGDRRAARDRAAALLERVGIAAATNRLGQYPHQLSGGLRQRVVIAMALMCGPDLVLADEPTTALDATIQLGILQLLAELQREMHMALVLVTHDLGVVARIADRVAVMYAGEVVEEGRSAAVFGAPRHPYTRGLMDCIPQPGRMAPGTRLGTIPGMVPSLVGPMRGCAFRGRCRYAMPVCAEPVAMREGEDGHIWRCVLPGGVLEQAA